MDKKERYLQWGYCEYKDTETDMVKGNYVQVMNEQVDKIADLEAKLAESEAKIACREDDIKFKEADINQLKWILEGKKKDIDQLKQQLAEMQNEKDELISKYRYWKTENFMTKNQTAIEALEKVKESLEDCYGYDYPHLYHFIQSKVDEKIDQQIKELKGEK